MTYFLIILDNPMSIIAIAVIALVIAVVTTFVSDRLLKYKWNQIQNWWMDSLNSYLKYVEEDRKDPAPQDKGERGACGIWLADARAQHFQGNLSLEKTEILAKNGIIATQDPSLLEDLESEDVVKETYSCPMSFLKVISGSIYVFLMLILAVIAGFDSIATFSLALFSMAMLVGVFCDVRAETIPWETIGIMLIAAIAFQFFAYGIEALGFALIAALIATVIVFVLNLFSKKILGASALGACDARTVPVVSLLSGMNGILAGAVSGIVSMGLITVLLLALRKTKMGSRIPAAPYLAVWSFAGVACPSLMAIS